MHDRTRERLKKFLFIPAVAVGIAIAAVMIRGREPPGKLPPAEQTRAVRVIVLSETTVVPRALGYGLGRAAPLPWPGSLPPAVSSGARRSSWPASAGQVVGRCRGARRGLEYCAGQA